MNLSFVETAPHNGRQKNFWDVTDTGNYGNDCHTGNRLAQEYLGYLAGRIDKPDYDGMERHLLGDIVLSMSDHIDSTSIKIGFFYELSRQIESMLAAQTRITL